MQKKLGRIFSAFLVSLGCYGATHFWYYHLSQKKTDSQSSLKSLAIIDEVVDEVLRRPASKTIWESMNSGQELYSGDAIKTSSQAEARIRFKKDNRYIDLESDSLIIISGLDEDISLDLKDGHLFFGSDAGGSGDSRLTLNSGKERISLDKSATISTKNGAVRVLANESEDRFRILQPSFENVIYKIANQGLKLKFKWENKFPNSTISFFQGVSRKQMEASGEFTNKNEADITIRDGAQFVQFKIFDQQTKTLLFESVPQKLQIKDKFPSLLTSPQNDVIYEKNKIVFSWSFIEKPEGLKLEISKDRNFKTVLVTENNLVEESSREITLENGDYYARLSSRFKVFGTDIQADPIFFHVGTLTVSKENYVLSWIEPQPKSTINFVNDRYVSFKWKINPDKKIKKWKVEIVNDKDPNFKKNLDLNFNQARVELGDAATYAVVIKGFEATGNLIYKSETMNFDFQVQPLLSSPQMLPANGSLKADTQGNIELRWNQVKDAAKYKLSLTRPDGQKIEPAITPKNKIYLSNLMPGIYKIQATSIDRYGRESEKPEVRDIMVSDKSAILAPKLKRLGTVQ